ncbi:MAG: hypothetical protein OEZ19_03950 [Paracoccaceae bacterium]|nr:hypothetical protein [Paracoccaceae bacterium]
MPDYHTRTRYYLSATADDYNPGSGELEELAAKLAAGIHDTCDGVADEGSRELIPPANPGDVWAASKITFAWVPVLRQADGSYSIPDDLPGAPFALAFGEDIGWAPDMIIDGRFGAAMGDILAEYGEDQTEWLACTVSEREVTLTFDRRDDGAAVLRVAFPCA